MVMPVNWFVREIELTVFKTVTYKGMSLTVPKTLLAVSVFFKVI